MGSPWINQDNNKAQVDQLLLADTPTNVGISVDSALSLMLMLVVTAGSVNSDSVEFGYCEQS